MCTTCGCGGAEAEVEGEDHGAQHHQHHHTHDHHHHTHDHHHHHDHDHDHHHHVDANGDLHFGQGLGVEPMCRGLAKPASFRSNSDILSKNDHLAWHNRDDLSRAGVLALNLVSSPGSGKTTLLARTAQDMADRVPGGGDRRRPADQPWTRTGSAQLGRARRTGQHRQGLPSGRRHGAPRDQVS